MVLQCLHSTQFCEAFPLIRHSHCIQFCKMSYLKRRTVLSSISTAYNFTGRFYQRDSVFTRQSRCIWFCRMSLQKRKWFKEMPHSIHFCRVFPQKKDSVCKVLSLHSVLQNVSTKEKMILWNIPTAFCFAEHLNWKERRFYEVPQCTQFCRAFPLRHSHCINFCRMYHRIVLWSNPNAFSFT